MGHLTECEIGCCLRLERRKQVHAKAGLAIGVAVPGGFQAEHDQIGRCCEDAKSVLSQSRAGGLPGLPTPLCTRAARSPCWSRGASAASTAI